MPRLPRVPPSASERLLDAGTPRPQAMLFTLWGDYVVHRGGEISVASLIRIAAEFGLSEVAVRALLARMARAGWLDAERRGRRSFYRLTARGRSVIREGTTRIFHPRPERDGWSGAWQIVAYSIPEAHRERRDQFRKRLVYLGFGLLASGAWISPYELTAEVEDLAVELRVRCYVELFHGCNVARSEAPALAARVWRLEPLAAAYQTFERRWRGLGAQLANGDVDDARAFALRFWLIHEYQRFFLEDPDLPSALLPNAWPGRPAAALFETLHARLAPGANRFFDTVYETTS